MQQVVEDEERWRRCGWRTFGNIEIMFFRLDGDILKNSR